MAKVYVLSHGHRCIAHRYGASHFDIKGVIEIFDSEEKVINHIRQNVENRVKVLSNREVFDEYPIIEEFVEVTDLIYARSRDDIQTETQYYYYKSYDVK